MATTLRFSLNISRAETLRYYKGSARFVRVRASNGQRIQFPAESIRPFIDQNGVKGIFSIRFDNNNKLVGLERIT